MTIKNRNIFVRYVDKVLFKYYCRKLMTKGRKTSMSDNDAYPVICYMASRHEHIFKGFRRNAVYNDILEHVSREQGQEYLDVLGKNMQIRFGEADWDNFCKNDLYGNPQVFSYKVNGHDRVLSPTTIRYAKVLQDIVTLFDIGKIASIAEIGIGYAGQCRLLTSYLRNLKSYSLFDLPEVLELAKRYLGKYGKDTTDKVKFLDGTNINVDQNYDFVISNYAFSELVRSVQDVYLEKVILRSKAGYMTWNTLSCEELDGYSLEELLEKIPSSSTIAEEPSTKTNNCIIIWGNK